MPEDRPSGGDAATLFDYAMVLHTSCATSFIIGHKLGINGEDTVKVAGGQSFQLAVLFPRVDNLKIELRYRNMSACKNSAPGEAW